MSEEIKKDQEAVTEAVAAPTESTDAPKAAAPADKAEEVKADAKAPEAAKPVAAAAPKVAGAKSFMDTIKDMSDCIVKQAPGALKTTLTVAGKGAEALSKALHKMSDMVPVDAKAKDTKEVKKEEK